MLEPALCCGSWSGSQLPASLRYEKRRLVSRLLRLVYLMKSSKSIVQVVTSRASDSLLYSSEYDVSNVSENLNMLAI